MLVMLWHIVLESLILIWQQSSRNSMMRLWLRKQLRLYFSLVHRDIVLDTSIYQMLKRLLLRNLTKLLIRCCLIVWLGICQNLLSELKLLILRILRKSVFSLTLAPVFFGGMGIHHMLKTWRIAIDLMRWKWTSMILIRFGNRCTLSLIFHVNSSLNLILMPTRAFFLKHRTDTNKLLLLLDLRRRCSNFILFLHF